MSVISEVFWSLVKILTDLVAGFFSFLFSVTPVLLSAIVTAGITVWLTFWYRRKYDKMAALRSLKTETSQNGEQVVKMLEDLYEKRSGFESESDTRTTMQLQTSAYDNLKNSGFLATLPPDKKRKIHEYNEKVGDLNRRIEQRDNVQHSDPNRTRRRSTVSDIDEDLFTKIISLSSLKRIKEMNDRLNHNSEVKKALSNAEARAEDRDDTEKMTFNTITETIDEVIENEKVLPDWIATRFEDWRSRFASSVS